MNENSLKTPATIRGVVNTENMPLDLANKGQTLNGVSIEKNILFDWFQFTIKFTYNDFDKFKKLVNNISINGIIYSYFKNFFNINSEDIIIENTGINGYTSCFSFKDICLYVNYDRVDMGVHFILKGKGCRDFEDLKLNWLDFIKKINGYDINYNRIDIAIDDFTNRYFTLKKILYYAKKGLIKSNSLKTLEIVNRNIKDGSISGCQLQIGSKASTLQITFYDKLLERQSQNYIIDNNIECWTRTELRIRNEKAKQVVEHIINGEELGELSYGILHNEISFLIPNDKDSNKSRWETCNWWLDFLDSTSKVKLTSINIEPHITKKKEWLNKLVSKSQLLVLLATLKNIELDSCSSEFIYDMLSAGGKKLKDKDIEMINDYRIKKDLPIITKKEVLDYVRDVKDVIIERKDSDEYNCF